ncbi:hypothetical protein DO021_02630 [Desulfobacter hydrogenophilus]|uniref:Uncharacterized protein n=1 Tax=Desulfobacter hydrogenophilus TaxID=2291 RepID=A0A328FFQ0_9BACT|nr:hypothetical protein DO021_02630 [Desulfobacter hydrogenophilus]
MVHSRGATKWILALENDFRKPTICLFFLPKAFIAKGVDFFIGDLLLHLMKIGSFEGRLKIPYDVRFKFY